MSFQRVPWNSGSVLPERVPSLLCVFTSLSDFEFALIQQSRPGEIVLRGELLWQWKRLRDTTRRGRVSEVLVRGWRHRPADLLLPLGGDVAAGLLGPALEPAGPRPPPRPRVPAALRSEVNNFWIIVNFFHKIQNFRQISDLFSQIWLKKRHTSLFSGIWREIRKKIHQKFAEKMQNSIFCDWINEIH